MDRLSIVANAYRHEAFSDYVEIGIAELREGHSGEVTDDDVIKQVTLKLCNDEIAMLLNVVISAALNYQDISGIDLGFTIKNGDDGNE
jgi:hypothetical protein